MFGLSVWCNRMGEPFLFPMPEYHHTALEWLHVRISKQIAKFDLPIFTGAHVQDIIDRMLFAHKRDVKEMRAGKFPPEKPPPTGMMFGVQEFEQPDWPDDDDNY